MKRIHIPEEDEGGQKSGKFWFTNIMYNTSRTYNLEIIYIVYY